MLFNSILTFVETKSCVKNPYLKRNTFPRCVFHSYYVNISHFKFHSTGKLKHKQQLIFALVDKHLRMNRINIVLIFKNVIKYLIIRTKKHQIFHYYFLLFRSKNDLFATKAVNIEKKNVTG